MGEMNLYPLKATVDGSVVRNLRLRARDDVTVVWCVDRASGAASEVVRASERPERVGATQNWRVGDLVFEQQRGCGCNHPMYTWVPPDE